MPHTETQTQWEDSMARRVMEQIRGELYLDQRYLNAALGALPPAQYPECPGHRRRQPVLSPCLGAVPLPQ